jgi:hypothetical protein
VETVRAVAKPAATTWALSASAPACAANDPTRTRKPSGPGRGVVLRARFDALHGRIETRGAQAGGQIVGLGAGVDDVDVDLPRRIGRREATDDARLRHSRSGPRAWPRLVEAPRAERQLRLRGGRRSDQQHDDERGQDPEAPHAGHRTAGDAARCYAAVAACAASHELDYAVRFATVKRTR